MKNKYSLYIVILIGLLFWSQGPLANEVKAVNANYDAELAKKLGADERGMKVFVIVTLVTGPNDEKITDKQLRGELFKGHFANMQRLADEGKLLLAGPYVEARPKRGMLIFDTADLSEAESYVKTDPTVEAGIFTYEMSKFYASAGLMQVTEIHKTIQQ